MKFFSILDKDELHENAGIKVIPKDEFSTLIEADKFLEKTKKNVKKFKKELREEAKIIKEKAYDEGFQEGLIKLNEIILKLNDVLESIKKDINKKILPVALSAAKKILGEEIKLHPDRIVDIVIQALKPVIQHHKIIIYVNKADFDVLEKEKSKIKKVLEQVKTFSIQERTDVETGGCIIETEAGIINAQLENQLRALEKAFANFMKK